MEDHTNFLLDWSSFYRGKSTEELTESLLITTMELESARFKAELELKLKDDELNQLKQLLTTAIIEKKEAQNQYQTLLIQYRRNHRQTLTPPPHSVASSVDDEHVTTGGFSFSSSDCEESIVSSPPPAAEQEIRVPVKALPERGKLLEAVVKAGPLLQNLLMAGPLPHWRHPPPVVVPAPALVHRLVWKVDKKRGFCEGSDSSTETKYQRFNTS